MAKIKFLVFGTMLFLVAGCYYDKEELLYPGGANCPSAVRTFGAEVSPLIQTKCSFSSDCHGAGAVNTGGPFTNYNEIKNKAIDIREQVHLGLMPKTGSLTSAELQTIICWIDSGSPNN